MSDSYSSLTQVSSCMRSQLYSGFAIAGVPEQDKIFNDVGSAFYQLGLTAFDLKN